MACLITNRIMYKQRTVYYMKHVLCCVVGVGGIEAEAVMLGQSISMVLPKVLGYKITGRLNQLVTSTDVVLTITKVCCVKFSTTTSYCVEGEILPPGISDPCRYSRLNGQRYQI